MPFSYFFFLFFIFNGSLLGNLSISDKAPGEWILGGGWNNDIWGGDLPIALWMDEFTQDNPVLDHIVICVSLF